MPSFPVHGPVELLGFRLRALVRELDGVLDFGHHLRVERCVVGLGHQVLGLEPVEESGDGVLGQEGLDAIDAEVHAAVDAAVRFADESPDPAPDELYTHVLAD